MLSKNQYSVKILNTVSLSTRHNIKPVDKNGTKGIISPLNLFIIKAYAIEITEAAINV